METLFELLPILIFAIGMLIFLVPLLLIMLISVVYVAGYTYDSILGNSVVGLGHFIGRKYPQIKENFLAIKFWNSIQPKNMYMRYETPLFAYCFSYTAISMLASLLPNEKGWSIIVASALYVLLYFVGMTRKYRRNELIYEKVLDNNMEFLKLSFLPLGFIITILGFGFTLTGMRIQELPFDFAIIENTYASLVNVSDDTNLLVLFLKIVISGALVLILFYVASLPVQVISYFIISTIKYFRKHKAPYIGMLKKYFSIVVCLLENVW